MAKALKKQEELVFSSYKGKYEPAEKRALKANTDHDPTWKYADKVFVAGKYKPQKETTVQGIIYQYVKAAGEKGIKGSTLVKKVRYDSRLQEIKSQYTKDGIPVVGWVEGYIMGCMTQLTGFIKLKN